MKIYQCKDCLTMVEEIKLGGCHASCCGKPMEELKPCSTDAAKEKHVPVYTQDGNKVSVTVGSVLHPMVEAHLIEWIAIETSNGEQKKFLKAGDEPKAEFLLTEGESLVAVYCYCNLHGLWKA